MVDSHLFENTIADRYNFAVLKRCPIEVNYFLVRACVIFDDLRGNLQVTVVHQKALRFFLHPDVL